MKPKGWFWDGVWGQVDDFVMGNGAQGMVLGWALGPPGWLWDGPLLWGPGMAVDGFGAQGMVGFGAQGMVWFGFGDVLWGPGDGFGVGLALGPRG